MSETTLKVSGMHCNGCEESIKRALQQVEGVTDVTADHASGVVTVRVEAAVPRAALQTAVEDAGYVVVPEDRKPLPTV